MSIDNNSNRSTILTVLSWLITPEKVSATDLAGKQTGRFALITILGLFVISVIGVFLLLLLRVSNGILTSLQLFIPFSLFCYGVSKFYSYRNGIVLLIVSILAAAFTGSFQDKNWNAIIYIFPLVLIIINTFLPAWYILVIAGATLTLANIFNGLDSSFSANNFANVVSSVVISSAALFIISQFQTNLEEIKINELAAQNKDLLNVRKELETKIEERTHQLNRRSAQLEASALVARSAAEFRSLQDVIDNVVTQITERFGYYHAGLFMTDPSAKYLVLQAASSEGGKRLLMRGYRVEISTQQGLVGLAAYEKRPKLAQDVGADAIYFNNPDLPETHSEVALPLVVQNKVIGILDIQSEDTITFSTEDLFTLQLMADQVALAIQNASLLAESQTAIEQLQNITSQETETTWGEKLRKQSVGYIYTPMGIRPISGKDANSRLKSFDSEKKIQVPIRLRGKKIGQVILKRKINEMNWSDKELEFTEKVADQLALAVENARLLEESQRRAVREQTINELSTRLSRSLDIETLLQNAVRELHKLPQVADVSVYIAPEHNNEE